MLYFKLIKNEDLLLKIKLLSNDCISIHFWILLSIMLTFFFTIFSFIISINVLNGIIYEDVETVSHQLSPCPWDGCMSRRVDNVPSIYIL